MAGIGTMCNVAGVIIGSALGLLIRKGLKEGYQKILMHAMGLATIFIGASGAMQGLLVIDTDGSIGTQGTMLMVFSLAIGGLVGEFLRIEDHMEGLGEKLKAMVRVKGDNHFVEGFVTSSLVICVGAMAVVGSLQDGLQHDPSLLLTKAILDLVICMVFASTLGIGVMFSAIPLGIYQGSITLAAAFLQGVMSDQLIANLSYIGSVLIFTVGINLVFGKTVKVGNMLPALLGPVVYEIFLHIF